VEDEANFLPQLWLNELFALIGRFLLNFICHASVSFSSGGVVFENSIDEKDRPKSLALIGRVDALSSAERRSKGPLPQEDQ